MTRTRLLPLEGGCNFRDCGGYPAADGTTVRWGRLYRSGVMSRLTAADIAELAKRNLRIVCDLRRTDERSHDPNPEFGAKVTTLAWDTGTETSPIRDANFQASGSDSLARAAMHRMYGRLPFVLRPRLAGVFDGLLRCDADDSIVVHCTAGKDRTGIAMALVLTALGVPRDVVIEDYVLTNTAVDLRRQVLGRHANGVGLADSAAPMRLLNELALEAVLAARPEYLLASFEAIDSRYETVEDYLAAELAVDASVIARLRASFLDA